MKNRRIRTSVYCFLFCSIIISHLFADFSMYPFFYTASGDGKSEFRALGPLIEYSETDEAARLFALRPFFSMEWNSLEDARAVDFIFPIFLYRGDTGSGDERYRHRYWGNPLFYYRKSYKKNGDSGRLFMLLPFIYHKKVDYVSRPDSGYTQLFPFYWNAADADIYAPFYQGVDVNGFAILPFWGGFENYWGMRECSFFLFPLWVSTESDDYYSRYVLFPIFKFSGGSKSGFRVFPLGGYEKKDGEYFRSFWLWPLGHYIKRTQTGERVIIFLPFYYSMDLEGLQAYYYFPFYGESRTPKVIKKHYLWPVYSVEKRLDRDYTEHDVLYFIFNYGRGAEREKTRFFIFYFSDERPEAKRTYILYPFWSTREETKGNRRIENKYLFPLYFSKKNENIKTNEFRHSLHIFPFWKSVNENGNTRGRMLSLWWYDTSEGIERNYAPLWSLYEFEITAGGDFTKEYLWGFFTRKKQGDELTNTLRLPFYTLHWKNAIESD